MSELQISIKMEKLAKMVNLGVSHAEIAAVAKVSEKQILQLVEQPEFQQQLAILKDSEITKMDDLNQGWDMVEERAITQVLERLTSVPDPDFALRAAALANKAQRRGGKYQNTVIVPSINMQAVINLNPQFVQAKEGTFQVTERSAKIDLPKKQTDMLSISKVQELLETKSMSSERNDLENCIDAAFKQVL